MVDKQDCISNGYRPRKLGLEEPRGQKQSFYIHIACRVFFLDTLPMLSLFYVSSASEDIFKKFLRAAFHALATLEPRN